MGIYADDLSTDYSNEYEDDYENDYLPIEYRFAVKAICTNTKECLLHEVVIGYSTADAISEFRKKMKLELENQPEFHIECEEID